MSGIVSPSHRAVLVAVLGLLGWAVAYIATGLVTLDAASRRVPLLVGAVTVVLLLVELALLIARRRAQNLAGPGDTETGPTVTWTGELCVLGSLLAAIVGIYLIGFLATLPLYLYGSIALLGGQRRSTALIVAVATTSVIYLAFEQLLSYRLFAGILFS